MLEYLDVALRTVLTVDEIQIIESQHVFVRNQNTDSLQFGNSIHTACKTFRDTKKERHVGVSIRTVQAYVPNLTAVKQNEQNLYYRQNNEEEIITLLDGLQL